MTDTANHAKVIRNFIETSDPLGNSEEDALTALDALTREADERKANASLICDGTCFECVKAETERDAARATIAAQSARIKALYPFLRHQEFCPGRGHTNGCIAMEVCTCGLRAALAPKEEQK